MGDLCWRYRHLWATYQGHLCLKLDSLEEQYDHLTTEPLSNLYECSFSYGCLQNFYHKEYNLFKNPFLRLSKWCYDFCSTVHLCDIGLHVLNQLCIPQIKPTWQWWMIFLVCSQVQLTSVLLKILHLCSSGAGKTPWYWQKSSTIDQWNQRLRYFWQMQKIPSGGKATYLTNDARKTKYLYMKNEIFILNPVQNNSKLI